MIYCLNPDCKQPLNPDGIEQCESCGKKLVPLLRARYRILRTLGQGGFGKTFLAVDEDRLKAKCVIKQFSPQLKGTKALEKAIQLFEQEAMRLYELGEHPHIPALLAYFEQDSRLYLVQQFIEGPTLAQELAKTGCFGEQKIREVLAGLLPILKFVHDRNVIHRDITPANIIRRKLDHRLVLIDFGVAKLLQESGTSIQPGTKIGTEGYAPIEQLRSGCAYPASDIYSLGATCLYLMTQTKPEELYDPLRGRWLWRENLQQRGVTFTDGIGRILDRMLKDLVSERYQSAAEVMQDLRVALSQPLIHPEKQPAAPPSSSNVTQLPLSQQSSGGGQASEDFLSDNISDLPTTGFRAHPLSGSPSAQSKSAQPRSTGGTGTPPSAPRTSSIPPSTPPSVPPSRPSGSLKTPQSLPERFSNAQAFSGGRATGGDPDSLCINVLKGHSSWILALAASPNGQVLVSAGLDDRIIVWDLVSGNQLMVLEGHHKPVNGLAFTPDGKTIVSCSDDTTIKLWELSTGRLLRVLKGHIRDVTSVAVSPDGQFIASGSEDRTVCIWRLSTGELLRSFPGVSGMVKSVCISANGQFIASGGLDNQIKIWNLNAGTLVQNLTGHVNSVMSVAMSENGRFLASGSKDRTIKVWNTQTGELIRSLQGNMDTVNEVAMSPDGRFLISGSSDKSVRVWRLSTGDPVVTLMEHTSPVNAIAISPNQRWFASAGSDSTVRIWSMKF